MKRDLYSVPRHPPLQKCRAGLKSGGANGPLAPPLPAPLDQGEVAHSSNHSGCQGFVRLTASVQLELMERRARLTKRGRNLTRPQGETTTFTLCCSEDIKLIEGV